MLDEVYYIDCIDLDMWNDTRVSTIVEHYSGARNWNNIKDLCLILLF